MTKTVHIGSTSEHEATYQELLTLISRHPNLSGVEMLAIAANMVGKLIALQDQRTMTLEKAMEIVNENVLLGNQQVIAEIMGPAAGNG